MNDLIFQFVYIAQLQTLKSGKIKIMKFNYSIISRVVLSPLLNQYTYWKKSREIQKSILLKFLPLLACKKFQILAYCMNIFHNSKISPNLNFPPNQKPPFSKKTITQLFRLVLPVCTPQMNKKEQFMVIWPKYWRGKM